MSIRTVLKEFCHPFNDDLVVLALDDGYPIVITSFDAIGIYNMSHVMVSGPTVDVEGILSYGDFAQPLPSADPNIRCSAPRTFELSLSAAFSGNQHTDMIGILANDENLHALEIARSRSNCAVDATSVKLGPEDKWVAFAGTKLLGFYCFDTHGSIIRPRISERHIWTRMSILDNFYTFCGIIHRPLDGTETTFEIHCMWNRVLCEPVGPLIDRRIAHFLNVPFAASVPIPSEPTPQHDIMVRIDNHTPILY